MQIKKKGIEVALDDFGTGYNDYSSLSLIDPDYIKIDRLYDLGYQYQSQKAGGLQ